MMRGEISKRHFDAKLRGALLLDLVISHPERTEDVAQVFRLARVPVRAQPLVWIEQADSR